MQQLNIVELIEKNPIVKLSNAYNNKLLIKIKDNFTGFEQQLFVSSFYCYLNYNKNIDFVVDLDNVWNWLGFTLKENAEKTGATLTQNIDEDGNLIGVSGINTQERSLKDQDTISAADIRAELFEGENIIVGKTDNGQSELLSGPFVIKEKDE